MRRSTRIVLVAYCLLLAYCCLWVPWHIAPGTDYIRVGYGWLWVGPTTHDFEGALAAPDLPLIGLRILALTAIAGAAYFVATQN